MSGFLQHWEPVVWITSANFGLLLRLLLAAVLGGLIGLERELSGKPAGLRTNLLICVGAALLMEISIVAASLPGVVNPAAGTVGDPTRIAAQIVSGIGFLGAGTILQSRGSIVGLTTAATIWVVAAIGMAVGARAYLEALEATILVFFSLRALSRVEDLLTHRRSRLRYHLSVAPDPALVDVVEQLFRSHRMRVSTASVEKEEDHYELSVDVSGPGPVHERVTRELLDQSGVRRVTRTLA